MNTPVKEGDPVRVTSGVYKDAEGIVEDLQPECSVMRVRTNSGNVYALLNAVEKIHPPIRMPKGNPLKK
jgi:transcription antitermination factor NusG